MIVSVGKGSGLDVAERRFNLKEGSLGATDMRNTPGRIRVPNRVV